MNPPPTENLADAAHLNTEGMHDAARLDASNPTPFALQHQLRNRERRPYNMHELRQLPPNRTGIYAIWQPSPHLPDTVQCVYVGMSAACIRTRLAQHLKDDPNEPLRHIMQDLADHVTFTYVLTHGAEATRRLEAATIKAWNPTANRHHKSQ